MALDYSGQEGNQELRRVADMMLGKLAGLEKYELGIHLEHLKQKGVLYELQAGEYFLTRRGRLLMNRLNSTGNETS